ncbi:hypothetical protein G3570_06390 [Balneolaceae bacterium YR4-1]|uniref:Uncharacterized protein n=1 Tax=Halalkalibaculum roseum TaxID=2709311 RepID=A0A6M1T7L9_9BACT|nr:hypothetical protein [Halalkalibaculum roseum]NGP76253.1 hypothetical protein [Halalkalibaculum roseum]
MPSLSNHYCAFLLLIAIVISGCSNSIYNRVRSNLPSYDNGTVIVEPDAAIFIFKPEPRSEWQWYQKTTGISELEYSFGVQFELDGVEYQCGYSLFKHPFARPDDGSFKELIDAGQVDLWKEESTSGGPIGGNRAIVAVSNRRMEYVRMRTLVDDNSLAIVLKEKDIVEQFNSARPDSIFFRQILPSEMTQRKSVKVTYRNPEGLNN